MTVFTTAEAEKQLPRVLEQARSQGEVRIREANGQEFVVRPAPVSPLDVGHVDVNPPMTIEEIVQAVSGRE